MGEDLTVRHLEKPSARIPRVSMRRPANTPSQTKWHGMGEAWASLSTIITGIGVWGAIGYGLDRLFDTKPILFVIGVLIGHFAAIYLIYVRALRLEEHVKEHDHAA